MDRNDERDNTVVFVVRVKAYSQHIVPLFQKVASALSTVTRGAPFLWVADSAGEGVQDKLRDLMGDERYDTLNDPTIVHTDADTVDLGGAITSAQVPKR